jgi:hypothetical protein
LEGEEAKAAILKMAEDYERFAVRAAKRLQDDKAQARGANTE